MWPVYMSGGGSFTWYVQEDGGGHSFDQRIDDFNEMDVALDWTGHALSFMDMLPVQHMTPMRSLVNSLQGVSYALVSTRQCPTPSTMIVGAGPLSSTSWAEPGNYVVKWFDPRNGGGCRTELSQTSRVETGYRQDPLPIRPQATGPHWS